VIFRGSIKLLKQKKPDAAKLLEDLTKLLDSLIQKITTPNSKFRLFHDNIESFVVRDSYLGYLFETKINEMKQSGFKDDVILRNHCIQFLLKLIKEITQRLPDNVDVLKQISVFSVNNTLRVVKPKGMCCFVHFDNARQK
jgi:hypothetical protein